MTDQILMRKYEGHLYAVVGLDLIHSWTDASTFIQTGLEVGTTDWHLATVSDAAENQVLSSLINRTSAASAIFGLLQSPGSAEPDEGWGWITGETLTYTNWNRGEPNNTHLGPTNSEEYGAFYAGGPRSATYGQYTKKSDAVRCRPGVTCANKMACSGPIPSPSL